MTTDIKIARPADVVTVQMVNWLESNVGPGSFRTIKNSFMGMDDWFYTEDQDEEFDDILDQAEPDCLIFTFRRENDATLFALKWTTTTTN